MERESWALVTEMIRAQHMASDYKALQPSSRRLTFSLRGLLLLLAGLAILCSCRQFILNTYHRTQIYALEHGYYNFPSPPDLIGAVDYHYSQLADAGAVSRVSKDFHELGPPDLIEITRLVNLPPHHFMLVERGSNTKVTVYADLEHQKDWEGLLDSLRP